MTTVAQLKSYILHLQLQQDERRINWRYAARKNIKSFDLPIRHDRIICVTVNCSGDEEQRIRTHTDYCVLSFIWLVLMFPLGLFGSVSLHMTDSWAHWFGLRSSFLHGDVFFLMHQESRGRSIQRVNVMSRVGSESFQGKISFSFDERSRSSEVDIVPLPNTNGARLLKRRRCRLAAVGCCSLTFSLICTPLLVFLELLSFWSSDSSWELQLYKFQFQFPPSISCDALLIRTNKGHVE